MKPLVQLQLLMLMLIAVSCNNVNIIENGSITGKAQKGPLLKGSVVTLSEINDRLTQSGRVFTSNITSDEGAFSFSEINLKSNFALLTATGFYFNEVYGTLSPAQITLQGYVDLANRDKINVNILTQLTKQRIEKLVADGQSISEAKAQAETEFLNFVGQNNALDRSFEDMDISNSGEANAILLAFSIMSQRYSNIWGANNTSTAELSDLLNKIAEDFKPSGTVSNQSVIDTIMHNISQISLSEMRKKVEERFSELGTNASVPDFEKYITQFQKKYSKVIYSDFEYPVEASPEPYMSPDGKIANLLYESQKGTLDSRPYSLAAIVPFDKTLKVKIISDGNYTFQRGGANFGWKQSWEQGSNVFIYDSDRNNMLISALIYLEGTGSAVIEIYENSSEPTIVRHIDW